MSSPPLPDRTLPDVVFVEVARGETTTVPHGERILKRQWKLVEESLFQPPDIRSFELAQMARVRPQAVFSPTVENIRTAALPSGA